MVETLLSQATEWGFVCNENIQGKRQILPQRRTERWQLQQAGDRWLLLVGGVSQVNLHPDEAMAFLRRRLSSVKRDRSFKPFLN
jgi:hypothetical protein